jgi:hypothetical protein
LIRVALTDREIVVIGPGPGGEAETETTLMVPEEARISRGEKAVQLEDLKEGERVVVKTEKRDGKWAAVSIQAGGPAAPAAARGRRIERVRQILRMVDGFLEQLAEQRGHSDP